MSHYNKNKDPYGKITEYFSIDTVDLNILKMALDITLDLDREVRG